MLNPFAQSRFLLSCASLSQLPRDDRPELAFAGRSNAGKSSALNTLTHHKQLARVSKTPGRTQLINLFELPGGQRLADLPGYGYADVPAAIRKNWGALIGGYVEQRSNLVGIVVIMDVRHPMTEYDCQLLDWVAGSGRSCHVLLTKADKLGFGAAKQQLLKVQKALGERVPGSTLQLFSSLKRTGVEEARERLAAMLGLEAGLESSDESPAV